MKIKYLLLIIGFFGFLNSDLNGQSRYTFVEDAFFFDPTDLFGYRFVPSLKEIPKVRKDELSPRDYSFGVTTNNLYLNYDGEKMIYNIQSINPTEYGFILALLDAKNIRETGHLKIILDGKKRARALVLKRTTRGKEEVFHISTLDEYTKEKEEAYYSDIIEVAVDYPDSLWNKQFVPYFIENPSEPLRTVPVVKDSISFSFYEDIVIEEKKKNRSDSSAVIDIENFDFKAISEDSLASLKDFIKVDHKMFLRYNYTTMEENGDRKMNESVHIIRKIDEKEDSEMTGLQERFMLELTMEKGDPIYIFLTEYKTISSIEYQGAVFSARYIP